MADRVQGPEKELLWEKQLRSLWSSKYIIIILQFLLQFGGTNYSSQLVSRRAQFMVHHVHQKYCNLQKTFSLLDYIVRHPC